MSLYCVKQDLYDRFGQSEIVEASDHNLDGIENIEAIDAAIFDASAFIDRHLAPRYVLPLPCIPESIKGLCCDIARYYLHDNRATEQITIRYHSAVKYLEKIRDRELYLYDPLCGNVFVELQTNQVVAVGQPQIYTQTLLKCRMFP